MSESEFVLYHDRSSLAACTIDSAVLGICQPQVNDGYFLFWIVIPLWKYSSQLFSSPVLVDEVEDTVVLRVQIQTRGHVEHWCYFGWNSDLNQVRGIVGVPCPTSVVLVQRTVDFFHNWSVSRPYKVPHAQYIISFPSHRHLQLLLSHPTISLLPKPCFGLLPTSQKMHSNFVALIVSLSTLIMALGAPTGIPSNGSDPQSSLSKWHIAVR